MSSCSCSVYNTYTNTIPYFHRVFFRIHSRRTYLLNRRWRRVRQKCLSVVRVHKLRTRVFLSHHGPTNKLRTIMYRLRTFIYLPRKCQLRYAVKLHTPIYRWLDKGFEPGTPMLWKANSLTTRLRCSIDVVEFVRVHDGMAISNQSW